MQIRQKLLFGGVLGLFAGIPFGEDNGTLEDVPTATAIPLDADKLVFLMDAAGVQDKKGNLLKELTIIQAQAVLSGKRNLPDDVVMYLPCAIRAC